MVLAVLAADWILPRPRVGVFSWCVPDQQFDSRWSILLWERAPGVHPSPHLSEVKLIVAISATASGVAGATKDLAHH